MRDCALGPLLWITRCRPESSAPPSTFPNLAGHLVVANGNVGMCVDDAYVVHYICSACSGKVRDGWPLICQLACKWLLSSSQGIVELVASALEGCSITSLLTEMSWSHNIFSKDIKLANGFKPMNPLTWHVRTAQERFFDYFMSPSSLLCTTIMW